MGTKRKVATYLTQEQGEQVIANLDNPYEWKTKTEIPFSKLTEMPATPRAENVFSIVASGNLAHPQQMHGLTGIIMAWDVLAIEDRPKKDEPVGNAYHLALYGTGRDDFPYLVAGPYPNGTDIPHWFDENQLNDFYDLVTVPAGVGGYSTD